MDLVGYADNLAVHAGERLRFMVSSRAPRYRAGIVRLFHGDDRAGGPGFRAEAIASTLDGEHAGHEQHLRPGSWLRVPQDLGLAADGAFSLHLWVQATTPEKSRQVLFASGRGGIVLALDHGRPRLELGGVTVAGLEQPLRRHLWYSLAATVDTARCAVRLRLRALAATAVGEAASVVASGPARLPVSGGGDSSLAAEWSDGLHAGSFFNGKLEAPSIYAVALDDVALDHLDAGFAPQALPGLLAAWDFALDIPTRTVTDTAGGGRHGVTVNRPTRAVTGHRWNGSVHAWRDAPSHYGAIHFHEDDLDDAGWQPSLTWQVPVTLPSGVYALHLEAPGAEDYVPFFVRPPAGTATARILFLVPTFSYLAYGNEQMFGSEAVKDVFRRMNDGVLGPLARDYPVQPQDCYIVANGLRSLYDTHVDGSGVCHASRLRPLVNLRPKYLMPALDLGAGSPHQFNADLHLVDWLDHGGYDCDVATDEDLHREGAALLERYAVVLTGTHHEYWSGTMLEALERYLLAGGRLLYLAGNGFYWVTEPDTEDGHSIEIRRAGPATRTWDARPGEACLAATGAPGGLWRHHGRAPQRLVGVGFTAQGTGPGRPYVQNPAARDGVAAFVFAGIAAGQLIGDHPNLVNGHGAAGFELDRVDHALGTPYDTIVLASASGFSDAYQHVSEEVLISDSRQGGTVNPLVRADMVLLRYPGGGAVFSPGSIAWCGALSWNGYDNSVSRVTANVLERFLDGTPL